MKYPTLDKLDCQDKTVFVRVDYNVSLNKDGEIRDDARIVASIPTLNELRQKGAKLVLASHLGRPKGKPDEKFSLLPVAKRLAELLDCDVLMPDDCVGMEVKKLIAETRPEGQVLLLENLRFQPGEESNDPIFSEKLASLADIYVNDAFGTMHRAHASTVGMVKHFKQKAIGRLVEKEVVFLGRLITEPAKPFVVVLGGGKVADKIAVIENLIGKADKILIGGGMAYTFLKARGVDVGRSLVDDSKLSLARRLMERARVKGVELLLPVDSVVADTYAADSAYRVLKNSDSWGEGMALDIGPDTIRCFEDVLLTAKTIFWNGPMGVYEMPVFQKGTNEIARQIAAATALSVVGGGDSLAAVAQAGVMDKISYHSTGGGASLEFLQGTDLPGLKVML